MAKIFIGFFNGLRSMEDKYAMPIFYETFINGLKNNGNDVFCVMHPNWTADFKEVPQKLLEEIKKFNPDLIFLFNNSFYDLSNHFECPIIVYEVDSPLYYRSKEVLKEKPNRFKYFTAASSSIDSIIDEFKVDKSNIIQVPFFTEIQAETIEQKHNICFIGTKFNTQYKKCTNKFMELKPSSEERKQFLNLIEKIEENPFIKKDILLANVSSEKILATFSKEEIVSTLSAFRRIKTLSNVADLGISIWGGQNWASDFDNEPWLTLNYNHEAVYSLKHNQDIYNSSKIGINIGHLQAKNGFPWRVFDIMASNACLVTEYHGDFSKYLPNLKLPYYSNHFEAREICKKLLQEESYRQDIVAQSQEIINKNYRFKNTLAVIENYLNVKLSQKSEGNCRITKLDEWFEQPKQTQTQPKEDKNLNFKNKIRYKIWKHYDKILKRKGVIK